MRGLDSDPAMDGRRAPAPKARELKKAATAPEIRPSGPPREAPRKKTRGGPPAAAPVAKKAPAAPAIPVVPIREPAQAPAAAPPAAAPPPPEPPAPGEVRSAETEAGKGEPVCGYGVEVVELLEMEPIDGTLPPGRIRPYHRWASAAFFAVFVLGLLNAGAVLLYYSPVATPDELAGGACELSGEVRDARGAPMANATVVITDAARSTFTNSDGWYVLKGIPAGVHRVEASAPGFGAVSMRVELRPNLLGTADFTLEKGGPDVRLDGAGTADFGESNSSYLWATPLLLALSVLALAAALLSVRRPLSRAVPVLGAASALSFGFGLGSVLAVAGVVLSALAQRRRVGPPLKKLRVGISYPQKRAPAPPGRAPPAGRAFGERYSVGVDEQERVQSVEPVGGAEGLGRPGGPAPGAGKAPEGVPPGGKAPHAGARAAPPADGRGDIEEVEVYLKERALRAKMASAEIEPSATLGRGEVDREAAPRPRRFVRRSKRGRILCFVCVNEIGEGQEYLRCSCGKTMHSRCLHEPRCPECGCSFRKGG